MAQSVADLEAFEFGDAVSRFLPEGSEVGGVDFVLALDLLDHQLGVRDDAKARMMVVECVLEGGQEAGVFGVVVGADAKELAELGDDVAVGVLNEGSEAGGAGVAAGSSVAMGADPVFRIFGGILDLGSGGCGGFGEEAGRGRTVGHWVSLSEDRGQKDDGLLTFLGPGGLSEWNRFPDFRSQSMNAEAIGMNLGGELTPSVAVGLRGRRTSAFGLAVESLPMAKAATQPATRNSKLTQAQLEARAQQRIEDDELIREAQKGQRAAFDALVRRYDQSVLRLALHMLGNEQDAQDVHQEAFIKAYRHLGNFRFECSFYTWLYRIVTNLCLDQLRRRKSRREDPATVLDASGDEMDLMANITDDRAMANPSRELDRKLMGAKIQDALGKLTPRERTVFELKHYQGLKLRTIGEMLNTTEETAKNTLFRATRKLRANLAELKA